MKTWEHVNEFETKLLENLKKEYSAPEQSFLVDHMKSFYLKQKLSSLMIMIGVYMPEHLEQAVQRLHSEL